MYTDDDLSSAVENGVLPAENAQAFREFVQKKRHSTIHDEEHFRLVTGFNDIFVVIAAVLALFALGTLGNTIDDFVGGILVAATAWGLSEYFTLKRRMALPSIVLMLFCLGGVYYAVATGFAAKSAEHGGYFVLAFALTAAVAAAHWYRFKVPITLAAGFATVIGIVISSASLVFDFSDTLIKVLIFISGVVVFAVALWWDSQDRLRQSRHSDVAFWLHLLAAPLLVHPIFVTIADGDFEVSVAQALITLVLYLGLSALSLILDRRALMVSALSYVVYVFGALLTSFGVVNLGAAIIGVVIGFGLLLVSVFWHPLRTMIMRITPASLEQLVPPAR